MKDLSLRLKTIASLVPNGARACDIGTDHGYLPIYLTKNNLAKSVIACDLNQKPLKIAKDNIEKLNADNITLRLCDGLSGISRNEVDAVIIAGMGGEVIAGIIERSNWNFDAELTFILQPTTSAEFLREFLCNNGFEILSETPVFENGKLYSIMLVKFSGQIYNFDVGYFYIGKMDKTLPDGLKYIKKQENRLSKTLEALNENPAANPLYNDYLSAYNYIQKILSE